jgi:hypothetical protein
VSDTGQTREQRQSLLIDSKLDSERIGEMTIGGSQPGELVGVKFASMLEVMEFAKLMALADTAVPPHLRNKPGSCLAVTIRALQLKMDPFTVANWSYEVEQSIRGEKVRRIAYEAGFYNAVILARAPIEGPLEYEILGEGDARKCKCTFTLRRGHKMISYISETLGKLRPGTNESGNVKGSPLWAKKPEVQMIYNTVRDVARIYFPHVTAGLYTADELADFDDAVTVEAEQPKPGLLQRLQPRATDEGFNQATATGQFDEAIQAARTPEPEIIEPTKKPRRKGGTDADAGADDSPAAEQAASSRPSSKGDAADPKGDKNGT